MLAAVVTAGCFACAMMAATAYTVLSPASTPPAQVAVQQQPLVEPPPSPTIPPTATVTPSPTPSPTPTSTPSPTPVPLTYALDWKIGQPVAYNTIIESLSDSSSIDYGPIFNFGQSGESDESSSPFGEMVEELQDNQPAYSLVSVLEKKPDGNISVKMFLDNVETLEESGEDASMGQWYGQMLKALEGTVQLQGDVTPDGAIASPFLAQHQKNLLALFFELPVGPVKVGDTWQLDLTCITVNSAQFSVERAERVNQVTLTDVIKTPEGEAVAVLDYVIDESTEGEQNVPMFTNGPVSATMKCRFLGRGEFLIDQGRWRTFSAENTIETTGIITANVKQQYALAPLAEVPEYPDPALQERPSFEKMFSAPEEGRVCWYQSEETIGTNAAGRINLNSYLLSDEKQWSSSKIAMLQVANIEPPKELLLNGEKFIRNPFEKEGQESLSLPLDPGQASQPAISLMLTFNGEEEVPDTISLQFAGQNYLLTLSGDETNLYCRK